MAKLRDIDHAYNGLIDVVNSREEEIAFLLEERNQAAEAARNLSAADKDRTSQKQLVIVNGKKKSNRRTQTKSKA